MATVLVAFDAKGRIVAAAEAGAQEADRPAEREGVTVAELEVPEEFADKRIEEYLHRSQVDPAGQQLVPQNG